MRIEEIYKFEEPALSQLDESLAIAKIRKEVKERSQSGRRPNIVVMQSPEDKGRYITFVTEKGKSYYTEFVNGKFRNTQKSGLAGMSKMMNELELQGWEKVDARGWVEKYKTAIFFGVVGAITATGLGAAGLVPVTAVLMPIISTFVGVFANFFVEHMKNPIKSAFSD